ncbi:MAG: hypothetical protein II838_08855 [Lachnospiraceae bacterium]|nr:hypothetical protein [Lachnospiraceae bacterium]
MKKITAILNILLIISVAIGVLYMFSGGGNDAVFATSGIYNLKYFTVQSNCLCGIIAIVYLACNLMHKKISLLWKYIGATEVGLTFMVIACFLQPMYPTLDMYAEGNLWFHLICPLIAMAELVLLTIDKKKMPIKWSMITMIPVFIYGTIYLLNVQINGIGKWPKSNDFYGFLNWGLPIGIIIFICIILMSWVIALLLRIPNVVSNRKNNLSLHREV